MRSGREVSVSARQMEDERLVGDYNVQGCITLRERGMEVGLLFMSLGGWNGKSGFLVEKKIRENFSGGGGVGGRREGRGK
jgi:hypothetical protein